MANNISINACDNQMIIVAYNWDGSYIIGDVQSGNDNPVDCKVEISAGAYTEGFDYNSVNGTPSQSQFNVTIPSGTYSLMLVGINWGGPANFGATINGAAQSATTQQGNGVVWLPTPVSITV